MLQNKNYLWLCYAKSSDVFNACWVGARGTLAWMKVDSYNSVAIYTCLTRYSCEKIIAKYGFTHLSTGDLLRAEVKSGSERAKTLTAIMEQGGLVPNDVVLELLKEAIVSRAADSKGFLVDGYPREKSQGIAFEQAIAPVSVIIYFEASSETLTKRLLGRAASSGRADDNEETIKLRLKTFLDNNQQVLDQYPDKISRINAEASVDTIFDEVQKILDPLVVGA